MNYLARVREILDELTARDLRRTIREDRGTLIDFSSNDYLALSGHPAVVGALHAARRSGSGGSRLLAGAHAEHRALEATLASLTGREATLVFSSGYLAALGTIAALAPVAKHAYSDRLNHASLIDAIRATGLTRTIYPHLSPPLSARESPAFLVSETVFGMDGDVADPSAIVASLGSGDVAIFDEAHAIGVHGPHGSGLAAGERDPRVIVIGTLSKALGGIGGFAAGPADAIELLRNTARTFMFDTSLPPALAEAARIAAELSMSDEGEVRRRALGERAAQLRTGLAALGRAVTGKGPIVPVIIGRPEETLAVRDSLEARGVGVAAVRPPTVPAGTSRLRIVVRADHTPEDVDRLIEAIGALRPCAVSM